MSEGLESDNLTLEVSGADPTQGEQVLELEHS